MATTANGLPYPVGTDRVVDGDDAIKALAEKVDALVLPFGFARVRCTTAAAAGAGAWNICWLDAMVAQHGQQRWTLEAASRRIRITVDGTYALSAVLTMNGTAAVGIALSTDGTTWDRVVSAPIGTVNFTNSCGVVRWIPAGTYVSMQMYHATTLATVADAPNSPCYLAIQGLGGANSGVIP